MGLKIGLEIDDETEPRIDVCGHECGSGQCGECDRSVLDAIVEALESAADRAESHASAADRAPDAAKAAEAAFDSSRADSDRARKAFRDAMRKYRND